jgi:hypothetical protein
MQKIKIPAGYRLIFRATMTDRNGKILYARDYGLKGFPILVKIK